jgi:hypothetical protein
MNSIVSVCTLMRCVWIRFVIRTFVYQSSMMNLHILLRRDSQTLARYSVKVRFLFYNAVDAKGVRLDTDIDLGSRMWVTRCECLCNIWYSGTQTVCVR